MASLVFTRLGATGNGRPARVLACKLGQSRNGGIDLNQKGPPSGGMPGMPFISAMNERIADKVREHHKTG
jgi:hypothetical protein